MTGNTNDNFRSRQSSDLEVRRPCGAPRLRLDTCRAILIAMVAITDVSALPLAPKNPLPLRQLVKLVRSLDTGQEADTRRRRSRNADHSSGRSGWFRRSWRSPRPTASATCWVAPTRRRSGASSTRKCATWQGTACSSCPPSRGCRASAHCNRSSPNTTSAISAARCRVPRRRSSLSGATAVTSTSTSNAAG